MKSTNAIQFFLFANALVAVLQIGGTGWAIIVHSVSAGWFSTAALTVFSLSGAFLFWAGTKEIRIRALGTAFFLAASDISHGVSADISFGSGLGNFLMSVPIEIFLGYAMWLLVGEFPRIKRERFITNLIRRIILVASIIFFTFSVIVMLGFVSDRWGISVANLYNFTDVFVYVLTLLSLPSCWFANRYSEPQERGRVRFFLLGLSVGLVPLCVFVALEMLTSGPGGWMEQSEIVGSFIVPGIRILLLTIPVSTGYALIVDEVLDLSVVLAKTWRYLFGKWVITFATVIPVLVTILYLGLMAGPLAVLYGLLVCFGVVALFYRQQWIEKLDTQFHRSPAAIANLLQNSIESIPSSKSLESLCHKTIFQLENALFPEYVRMYVLDQGFSRFRNVSDSSDFLRKEDKLVKLALSVQRAVDCHDMSDTQVVVPLYAIDGWLIGLITLGAKKSELPYLDSELDLLSTLGKAVSLGLESKDQHESLQKQPQGDGRTNWLGLQTEHPDWLVRVCPECRRTYEPEQKFCCGRSTLVGTLPLKVNGRFDLIERLGAGTAAEVYKAIDIEMDRYVALKVLHNTEIGIEELQQESKTCAALQHPSLASIFDIQWCNSKPLLVFELLEGGTLEQRLRVGPIAISDVLTLGVQMAEALSYIHDNGIWHQDIKPSNIAFTRDAKPKILDFGLAKMVRKSPKGQVMPVSSLNISCDESQQSVSINGLVGTPVYWSPETIQGKPSSPAVDVWALALVLYEMVAGCSPVTSENWFESASKIVAGSFPTLDSQRHDCPKGLSELIEVSLQPNLEERLSSASELHSALIAIN